MDTLQTPTAVQHNPVLAAHYAALVLYAWDMCNIDLHCCAPAIDPRIQASGWTVTGYILGSDNILKEGKSPGKKRFSTSNQPTDRVCYGYLAHNQLGQYIAVIRGTDGAEEWFDDVDFFQKTPKAPLEGQVDSGFYDIFDSMIYQPLGGGQPSRLAEGIATVMHDAQPVAQGSPAQDLGKIVPARLVDADSTTIVRQGGITQLGRFCVSPVDAKVTILGHSLGSALSTYLSAELTALCDACLISVCLFASPKPGNKKFSAYYESLGLSYDVFNYQKDLVPDVPLFEYSSLQNIHLLPEGGLGNNVHIAASKACCHHLTSYIALLSSQVFEETIALPETTPDDHQCAECVTLIQPHEQSDTARATV